MPDKGYCIITARKEVPSREDARAIYDLVKGKFADRPDIVIAGHFSNHFDLGDEPQT